jgi:hypothetical protein
MSAQILTHCISYFSSAKIHRGVAITASSHVSASPSIDIIIRFSESIVSKSAEFSLFASIALTNVGKGVDVNCALKSVFL